MDFSIDKFLDGKVLLKQHQNGLRATSDSVLVSAIVPAQKGETILDVGAGNGIIGLCVASRVFSAITAVEVQKKLCLLIHENAILNNKNIDIFQLDIFSSEDPLKGKLFHHVVTNPPFYKLSRKIRKNLEQKKAYFQDFDLKKWLNYCLKHLRSKGSFCLIHSPEALPEILSVLAIKLGNIEIFPITPKEGKNATRVLIRGYLNKKGPLILHSPLVMHTKENQRTLTAEKILRQGDLI